MRKFIELYIEVMSVSTRKKMSKRMAKLARSPAVKMKKARTRLKVRSTAKLAIVARKQALKTIKLKYYPTYDEMPMAQRIKVDQKIQQKYGKAIDKIVRKKMTALKSTEVVRVAKAKEAKKDA
jgi:hypothetical protein